MSRFTFDEASVRRIARSVIEIERRLNNPGDPPQSAGGFNESWHSFKNVYSGEIPGYAIMAITAWTATNDPAIGYFSADQPSTTFRRLYAVNSALAVPSGGGGLCAFSGTHPILYDSGTPAFGEGWGPKPGQFTLSKGFPGITINGIIDVSNKIALASLEMPLGSAQALLGKTTGAITGGSASTSYRFYAGGTLGSESDAGWTTVPSALSLEPIDSGLWITLKFMANGWRMEPLECNA